MRIETRDPADLKPHPRNSRVHTNRQVTEIARAITEFGFTQPVVVTPDGLILVGHARTAAAKSLGMTAIPVVVAKDLSEAQQRGLIVADNALHEFGAGWDKGILEAELRGLASASYDVTLSGFDPLEPIVREAPDEDDAPPPQDEAVTQGGQLWALGEHRLMIGDSTDPVAVARCLGEHAPNLMVTDPPYGVEYNPQWRNEVFREDGSKVSARATGQVLNDDNADWREAWKLFPGGIAYVWHAAVFSPVVAESLEAAGFVPETCIVWAKNRAVIGRGAYHWQHEPCWFAKRPGAKAPWQGGQRSDVWEISHSKSVFGHGTQKPTQAMRIPMLIHTKAGERIYDPFLGSGTTIIAAETCARVCLGLELNPVYADVIIRRWQAFTGQDACVINPDNAIGASFSEMEDA